MMLCYLLHISINTDVFNVIIIHPPGLVECLDALLKHSWTSFDYSFTRESPRVLSPLVSHNNNNNHEIYCKDTVAIQHGSSTAALY